MVGGALIFALLQILQWPNLHLLLWNRDVFLTHIFLESTFIYIWYLFYILNLFLIIYYYVHKSSFLNFSPAKKKQSKYLKMSLLILVHIIIVDLNMLSVRKNSKNIRQSPEYCSNQKTAAINYIRCNVLQERSSIRLNN